MEGAYAQIKLFKKKNLLPNIYKKLVAHNNLLI